jgi:hypothetical protein
MRTRAQKEGPREAGLEMIESTKQTNDQAVLV